jgi:putative FmdB family regulatory protein
VPLYEYRCKSCGHQFEKLQSFSAPDEKECPVCHGPLERLVSASALQFKGSGWYATDYASKPKSDPMKATADGDGKSSDKNDGKSPDKKSTDKPASTSTDSGSSSSSTTPPVSKSE